jgi:hypothetical protein
MDSAIARAETQNVASGLVGSNNLLFNFEIRISIIKVLGTIVFTILYLDTAELKASALRTIPHAQVEIFPDTDHGLNMVFF